jgi:type VI secretion system VgrG family protein
MSELKFTFSTDSYPDQFELVGYTGSEAISELFEFRLSLKVARDVADSIDFQIVVNEGCLLSVDGMSQYNGPYQTAGILKSIDEDFHGSVTHKYYTAIMVPALWLQARNKSYDIYVDNTAEDILNAELSQDVMVDYQLSLTKAYPIKNFICQYAESNFSFVNRLANHWGIYYYFDHEQQGKLIFADDTNYDDAAIPTAKLDISNNPTTSFDTVRTLRRTYHSTPTGVVISETNPDQASEQFEGFAGEPDGKNCIHLINEGCDSKDEASMLADVRLEEYQSHAIEFEGTSGIPCLAPGFVLTVEDNDGNQTEILITHVSHMGSNLDNSNRAEGEGSASYYEASFTGIPRDVQYRPQHNKILKPRAISTTARIHSDDDKKNIAQRNDVGKYQVIFDFLKDEKKVSNWIRKARQTARTNHFDMPLTPGTEVQIAFIDGNPDRPYIQSALENSQSVQHPVTNANPHHASIRTDGMLYTETAKSRQIFHVSDSQVIADCYDDRNNNPYQELDYDGVETGEQVDEIAGKHHMTRKYGDEYAFTQGNEYNYANGKCVYNFGNDYTENHLTESSVVAPNSFDITDSHLYSSDASLVADSAIEASKQVGIVEKTFGNTYSYHAGVESNWFKGPDSSGIHKSFNYGGRYEENQCTDPTARDDSLSGFPSSPSDSDLVTKTFGNTFDLQEGDQTEVVTGNVTTELTGDTEETITGNQTSTVTGDITETITGNQEATVTGDITETIIGNQTETLQGDIMSTHVGMLTESITGDVISNFTGSYSETVTSSSTSVRLSAASEAVLGAYSGVFGGAAVEIFAGGKVETHSGLLIANEKGELKKKEMDIEQTKTAIRKAKVNIINSALTLIG